VVRRCFGGVEDNISDLKMTGYGIHRKTKNDMLAGGGTQPEDDDEAERSYMVKEERWCY